MRNSYLLIGVNITLLMCTQVFFSVSPLGSVLIHYETELERLTTKYAGLNSAKRSAMDTLLMEGDLLEVALDEVQQLWQLLQQDAHLLTSFQKKGEIESEVCVCSVVCVCLSVHVCVL